MENTVKKARFDVPEFDRKATLERVRDHFGSVAEAQRQLGVNPRTFYLALQQGTGLASKRSTMLWVIRELEDRGLLVKQS